MICLECKKEYSGSNAENPDFYCSDKCEWKLAEKNYDNQVKYSEAERCRDAFENNRMRGKY